MQLLLEIQPSFLNPCTLTIEGNQLSVYIHAKTLVIVKDVNDKSWNFTIDNDTVKKLTTLTQAVINESRRDDRIILDGVSLICSIKTEKTHREFKFRCPQKNTNELELVRSYLDVFARLTLDDNLNNYLEFVEGYFMNRLPIKEFNEAPYRLRIYSSLSIYEKEGLTDIINRLSKKKSLVVDMTNFQGMGTALHECFEPLKAVSDLKILANDSAFKHMTMIGFTQNQIERTK